MLTYTNQRLQKAAMGYAGAALISGGVFGSVTLILWWTYLEAPENSSISIWHLILITTVVTLMIVSFVFAACVSCSEVQIHPEGLLIKTDLVRRCVIPWTEVIDVISWSRPSRFNPRGDTTFVMVSRGLSFWHYSPVRTSQGQIRWALGFVVMVSGQNYRELVTHIREQSGADQGGELCTRCGRTSVI
ncbi:MAG: hypothetical protein RBT75_10335 [Anaerolineae bacterium]|jgi:hypothetical protein|nr:hypothetical protein [Anaerolineae bacterium]